MSRSSQSEPRTLPASKVPVPAGFPVSCGTLCSFDSPYVQHVFTDVRCARCGHAPCPCCEAWCDCLYAGEYGKDWHDGGVEPPECPCFDENRCDYGETVGKGLVLKRKTPSFVELDDQWLRALWIYLESDRQLRCHRGTAAEWARADAQLLEEWKSGYLCPGIIVQNCRLFCKGDAVLVYILNGGGERQVVFGCSSKGRLVDRLYLKYSTSRWTKDYKGVEDFDAGPLRLMYELPDEMRSVSPFDPAVSDYIRGLRAGRAASPGTLE